jgi:hypothetical protein
MVSTSPTIIDSSGTSAPESLLVRYVKAHVKKGEQAKERAAHNNKKSEDHFVAAGRYLTMLKATYAPSWQAWESILKLKVNLSTGRASELMQLADGRKTVEGIRADKNETSKIAHAKERAARSSLNSSNSEEDFPDEPSDEEPERAARLASPSICGSPRGPQEQESDKVEAHRLIDIFAGSTPSVRNAAVEALISGSRQLLFTKVSSAIADLYQALMKAGR